MAKRKGKIERSPHYHEYRDMLLRGCSMSEIMSKARESGELYARQTWYTWKRRELEKFHIVNPQASSKTREEKLGTINQLYNNLQILDELLHKLLQDERITEDHKRLNELKNILAEIRLTISVIYKLESEQLNTKYLKEDEVIEILLQYLSPLGDEILEKLIQHIEMKMAQRKR